MSEITKPTSNQAENGNKSKPLLPAVLSNYEKAVELQKEANFSMRTCWECNGSHEHLKHVSGLFSCFDCGRWYMNGGFFDNEEHCDKTFIELPKQEFIKITISKK
jgi:ribosomal protein L37AE/L43A